MKNPIGSLFGEGFCCAVIDSVIAHWAQRKPFIISSSSTPTALGRGSINPTPLLFVLMLPCQGLGAQCRSVLTKHRVVTTTRSEQHWGRLSNEWQRIYLEQWLNIWKYVVFKCHAPICIMYLKDNMFTVLTTNQNHVVGYINARTSFIQEIIVCEHNSGNNYALYLNIIVLLKSFLEDRIVTKLLKQHHNPSLYCLFYAAVLWEKKIPVFSFVSLHNIYNTCI